MYKVQDQCVPNNSAHPVICECRHISQMVDICMLEGVWVNNTSFTLPLFVETPLPIHVFVLFICYLNLYTNIGTSFPFKQDWTVGAWLTEQYFCFASMLKIEIYLHFLLKIKVWGGGDKNIVFKFSKCTCNIWGSWQIRRQTSSTDFSHLKRNEANPIL